MSAQRREGTGPEMALRRALHALGLRYRLHRAPVPSLRRRADVVFSREQLGAFKDLKAQFNVYNVMNSQYWASVGTNGFIASDPQSVNNNTLQVGSPRTIGGTLSVRF